MTGTLEADIKTGGDFCKIVVDLALEVADITVLLSFGTSKALGLKSVKFSVGSLLFIADTACNAESRSAQMLLDEFLVQQTTSSAINYVSSDTSAPDGAFPQSPVPKLVFL